MSYEAERLAIYTAFLAAWGSTTPVQLENQDFTPPDSGPYVAVYILRGQSQGAGIVGGGQVRYRHPGVLQIDVVIERDKGTKVALDLVDQASAIFRGKKISGILFRAPDVVPIDEPGTARLRYAVSIPFQRDENLAT